jgi:hypothetical protein
MEFHNIKNEVGTNGFIVSFAEAKADTTERSCHFSDALVYWQSYN